MADKDQNYTKAHIFFYRRALINQPSAGSFQMQQMADSFQWQMLSEFG